MDLFIKAVDALPMLMIWLMSVIFALIFFYGSGGGPDAGA